MILRSVIYQQVVFWFAELIATCFCKYETAADYSEVTEVNEILCALVSAIVIALSLYFETGEIFIYIKLISLVWSFICTSYKLHDVALQTKSHISTLFL